LKNKTVATRLPDFADEAFNVRGLPVAPADKPQTIGERAEFLVPQTLAPGDYGVFVSVGSPMGTPRIALPLDGDDGQRRYLMGRVKLTAG